MAVSASLRSLVAKRDNFQCAYCQTSEANCGLQMHVDHIVPVAAGGATRPDNICLACFACNIFKGSQQTAVDPITHQNVPLFHPVQQHWPDHFAWHEESTHIIGRTAIGRATIEALQMNNATVVRARRRWADAGWHPPQ
jgi:hypothetical protein